MNNSRSKNNALLQVLLQAKRTRLRGLLQTLTKAEVDTICELVLNSISSDGGCPLTATVAKQCSRHKRTLRQLAFNKKLGWKKRKAIINQRGGAAWLIPILSSVAGTLLSKLWS